jgi:hypothetical protein
MISRAEYEVMQARLRGRQPQVVQAELGSIRDEAELHEQIAAYCRSQGWLALHGRMDRKTGRTLGEPDFVIFAQTPRVFLVECKRPGGKLSLVQNQTAAWFNKLGWPLHVVTSFEEFLGVLK